MKVFLLLDMRSRPCRARSLLLPSRGLKTLEAVVERERRRRIPGAVHAPVMKRALASERTKYGKSRTLLVVVDEVEHLVGLDRPAGADAELLAPLVRASMPAGRTDPCAWNLSSRRK